MTTAPELISRADVEALDAADPLAGWRARFDLPDHLIYLDGNSLGPPPVRLGPTLAELIDQWRTELIEGWDRGWWDAPVVIGEQIAPLLGAGPGQVVVCDSTSVNLYKLAVAGMRLRDGRRRIVTEEGNFPSDRYLLDEVARQHAAAVEAVPAGGLEGALSADTALLALTHVDYRTGAMHDMARLTESAHDVGAVVLWDLSHSVGAVPLSLDEHRVDLAVGCSYKYLNGGPGAPAWCYVAERHQEVLDSPLPGWVGHDDPFAMADGFRPAAGVRRLLVGTPPMLALWGLSAALSAIDGVSIADLRAKSLALTDLFIGLAEARLVPRGLAVLTPREHPRRGSQVSLGHPEAAGLIDELAARGVIGDHRPPDILRFGFTPLYLRFVDVWDAVDQLEALVAEC